MRISANVALQMLRSRTRLLRRDAAHVTTPSGLESDSPEARKLKAEEAELLRREVSGLPENLRESIVLRFFAELDYADVAAALSCSPDAAKKRVRRALDLLRARLAVVGLTLTVPDLLAHFTAEGTAHAASVSASQLALWNGVLNNSAGPALTGALPVAGVSFALQLGGIAAALLLAGATTPFVPHLHPNVAPETQVLKTGSSPNCATVPIFICIGAQRSLDARAHHALRRALPPLLAIRNRRRQRTAGVNVCFPAWLGSELNFTYVTAHGTAQELLERYAKDAGLELQCLQDTAYLWRATDDATPGKLPQAHTIRSANPQRSALGSRTTGRSAHWSAAARRSERSRTRGACVDGECFVSVSSRDLRRRRQQ